MAYGLKYQSDFYNAPPFQRLVSVKIYKRDYTEESSPILVRTTKVEVKANYQDDNTPIIGSGATVSIVANIEDLTFLEELLVSYERQFMCTIEYEVDSELVVVFRGYSICDLNERQLLPYAEITMQFTDYMHRLEEHFPDSLRDSGQKANVFSLIIELLTLTGIDLPLYINSTLFETAMAQESTDTWLSQITVQNMQFYTDAFTYDNIYDAVNKCLQPFNAFLYYYNDGWYIERQEDITRDGNWVMYSGDSVTSIASLKQLYNKQLGDWQYVDLSQVIEYNSGLHTLILQLQDKKLDSLVFNNFTKDMLSTEGMMTIPFERFPRTDQLRYRTWYHHEDVEILDVGSDFQDITSYVHFSVDPTIGQFGYQEGLYYSFAVSFNQGREGGVSDGLLEKPTILDINYKMSTDQPMFDNDYNIYKVQLRFLLRLDGGVFDNWWLLQGQSIGMGQIIWLYPPIDSVYPVQPYSTDPAAFCCFTTIIDVADEHQVDWSITRSINLTSMTCHCEGVNQTYDSLWEALQFPEYQKFIIMFLSPWYSIQGGSVKPADYGHIFESLYLGDIAVTVTVEDIDNKIEYHINEDFVKTDTIDLYLFDLPNINYSNGLMLNLENVDSDEDAVGIYTRLWTSENSVTPAPLYEVFAKCKFRKYGRTIHGLKGKISCDKPLKVFSILTDDTIPSQSSEGGDMLFLLNGYTWDLVSGMYDIEAEEYTEEDVIIDGVVYDEQGNQIGGAPASAPAMLIALHLPLLNSHIVSWAPVAGNITGYILQRKPFFHILTGLWGANDWWTYYQGPNRSYTDDITRTGPPPIPTPVVYRVCAYNADGNGPWSSEFSMV